MAEILKYLLTAMSLAAFCRCGTNDRGIEKVHEDWMSEDCMNGYCIVSDSLLSGLTDSQGNVLVSPTYGRLFFLTGDVLAGYESSGWTFIDTNGRALAETGGNIDDEPDSLLAEYQKIRRRQDLAWDRIVAGYETFCEACSEPDADADDAQMMSDSLMREISMTEGIMSPQQRRRIEVALNRYRERRRAL